MQILGIGIDTLYISRIKDIMSRRGYERLIQKLLTLEEQRELSFILNNVLENASDESVKVRSKPKLTDEIKLEKCHSNAFYKNSSSANFVQHVSGQQFNVMSRYLSARFCIKESIYKAMYPVEILKWKDVSILKWKDVSILKSCSPSSSQSSMQVLKKPIAVFHNEVYQSKYKIDISMTHEEDEKIISVSLITMI